MDVTTILAIYGSALSTIVFFWKIFTYLRDRPRLKVRVDHHALLGPGVREHKLGIKMVNVGKGKITMVASGFKYAPPLPDGSMGTIVDPDLPKELDEGQPHTSFADPSGVPQDQVLYGWVRDATGHIWKSKRWPLRTKK